MQKSLVSVVIPIYNVEQYLERCLNSVVNQTYQNLEIILVDDGSSDSCPQICDEWANKDKRIKVIHKENEGLGMARNTGIDNATGEYICFWDSDDYVSLNTIEKCCERLKEEKAEMIFFGLTTVNNKGEIISTFVPDTEKQIYENEEILSFFLPELIAPNPQKGGKPKLAMSANTALYSTKLINEYNWRFVSERQIISEDVYSLLSFYRWVKKVVVLPEALYFYYKNTNSLTQSYRKDRYEKIKYFYLESIKLCEKLGYSSEIKHRISKPYLAYTITALKQEVLIAASKKKCENPLKKIIEDELLQKILENNKEDKVSITRKILFWAIRHKQYGICYMLLKAKT